MASRVAAAAWCRCRCTVLLLAVLTYIGSAHAARKLVRGKMPYRVAKRRIIVKLRPDIVAAMDSSANGLRFARQTGLPNAAVYSILDGTDVHEKARQISRLPAVEFAEPDYLVRVDWEPNDSLMRAEWHHSAISSRVAWNVSRGSSLVKVCHIDSGVRTDHPDLRNRVLKGWNLVPEVQDFDSDSPAPGTETYANINDTYGHGTHTAGLIAAVGNNGLGVAGVAMDIRLLVCRFIWDDGFGSISDALECLRLCREEGAAISTNSWGGVPHSQAIDAALKEIEAAGMLFVVASGNQGTDLDARPAYPASSSMANMIVVGSSGRDESLSSFSSYGRRTAHLLAPGEDILSTTYNNWYGTMDGTSMACPLVAAAAALLQSAALSRGVTLSYDQMKRLLLSTVDPSPGRAGTATITGGRLNAGAAMLALNLLLRDRGQAALPGAALAPEEEEALRRGVLSSQWGQGLVQEPAGLRSGLGAPTSGEPGGLTFLDGGEGMVTREGGGQVQASSYSGPPEQLGR